MKKGMHIMLNQNNFFVKLNCKNINSMKSLIIDRQIKALEDNSKYLMCAGKYDKNGWTFVFRTKSYEEAEKLASLNLFEHKKTDKRHLSF